MKVVLHEEEKLWFITKHHLADLDGDESLLWVTIPPAITDVLMGFQRDD